MPGLPEIACGLLVQLKALNWTALSASAAALGLLVNAWAIRQGRRTRELQLFRDIFKDILQQEKEIRSAAQKGMTPAEMGVWRTTFCQTLEYFAFLWNHRLLKDHRLTGYFGTAVVHWYEAVFLLYATEEEKANDTVYLELKKLYKRLRKKRLAEK
jgi:hypothetical protein